jgi:hypothetical protein
MYTMIHGQSVDCAVAFGLVHQVVRTYEGFRFRGECYPGSYSERVDADPSKEKLPWFLEFRESVQYLEEQPWTGHVLSYVRAKDGSGPSWITAGQHYTKRGGDPRHPLMLPFKSTTGGLVGLEGEYFLAPEAAERHRAQFGGEVVQTSPDHHGREGIWRVYRRVEA